MQLADSNNNNFKRLCCCNQMESLQEEIVGVRKTAAETSEQLTKARNQLSEKDEDYNSLQTDSRKQLVEVYEMKYVSLK